MNSLTAQPKQVRTGVGASRKVRLGLAACALVLWALAALAPTLAPIVAPLLASHVNTGSSNSSIASAIVPQATVAAGNAGGSASFYQVLETAGASCPSGRAVAMLADYTPAYNLGNYYLYPRKLDLVGSSDPFDLTALARYSGGCLLAYDRVNIQRAAAFSARLQVITCSFDGCLYSVK